jgi:diaminohydroxyphosphoribosylaminopyrimidine deaminase/5-amino-6-(5-phosphoribosylamino)uracil reductase
MSLALRLAEKGRGTTSPNPMAGAVVVRHGRIVGRGFHLRPGLPHAEILALLEAGPLSEGADLYITLEPCCHTKKRTPPCVPAVLESGLRRVIVAMTDPNPLVNGKGIAALRRAGLPVTVGIKEREAVALNRPYSHWVTMKRPYVILKAGMTLDGQIATVTGRSRWITGLPSRTDAHRLRGQVDAVLIGVGTVLKDDPSLTARTGSRLTTMADKQPLRIVVDSTLRVPPGAHVLAEQENAKTLVATTAAASASRRRALEQLGIEIITVPSAGKRVSLPALLRALGHRGITSVLVEGGGEINASLFRSKLIDHVCLYVAPLLLGGVDAKGLIGGRGPARIASAAGLRDMKIKPVGDDFLVEGDL